MFTDSGGIRRCRGSVLMSLVFVLSLLFAGFPASSAGNVAFTLKYGVLAGLTGGPAPSGQAWNEAAKVAVNYVAGTLRKLQHPGIKVVQHCQLMTNKSW